MRLAVALAQWSDFATFAMGVALLGGGIESNPAMAGVYSIGGLLVVAFFKAIAVAGIITAINIDFRWARQVACLAIGAGVGASALNVTAVLLI